MGKLLISSLMLFLLLLAVPAFAVEDVEEWNIEVNAASIEKLVDVTTPLALAELIPQYEYSSYLTVAWAIPESAIGSIAETDTILIFVEASVSNSTTALYFKDSGVHFRNRPFILRCNIAGEGCGAGSKLSENISFYVKLEKRAERLSDLITVRASLNPFGPFLNSQELVEANTSINELRLYIESAASATDISSISIDNTTLDDLFERIGLIEEGIAGYDVTDVQERIAEIRGMFENITKKHALILELNDLEREIQDWMSKDLTETQQQILDETTVRIAEAKAAIGSSDFDFDSANVPIRAAREKLSSLASLIPDGKGQEMYILGGAVLLLLFAVACFILWKTKRAPGKSRR